MSYSDAHTHYSSARRSDYVKREWERPLYTLILASALRHTLSLSSGARPLRIFDVGAGSGEACPLISSALLRLGISTPFEYWALDTSGDLLAMVPTVINQCEGDTPVDTRLLECDMRTFDFAAAEVDLFVCVGASYSHLATSEFAEVVSSVLQAMSTRTGPSAAIFDVLGRYSVEWLPLATTQRREYSMSFFVDTDSPPTFPMTFFAKADLESILAPASRGTLGSRAAPAQYWDRSVFTGRHTSTALYNPALPDVRSLVNELAAETGSMAPLIRDLTLSREALGLDAQEDLPSAVRTRLERQQCAWNAALNVARDQQQLPAHDLCASLRQVDQWLEAEGGLGCGHSLTALVCASGS